MIQLIAFYLFAALMLVSGSLTILSRNPVHSVLWLILAFFNAAGLMVLVGAEFLAITLVLVYVGAVMVLFLFVVMMLDINIDSMRKGFWKHFPLAAVMGAVIALEMAAVLMGGFRVTSAPAAAVASQAAADYSNTKELGKVLYSQYLLPLQAAAALLLVAIIAAIALTLRERKDSKSIDASEQVRVKRQDRVRLLKINPSAVAAAPEPIEAQEPKT